MNQSKLALVKQEMAKLNIDKLGISELKTMEAGEFNSDDPCFYYCGRESFRVNSVTLIVHERI